MYYLREPIAELSSITVALLARNIWGAWPYGERGSASL